MKKLIPVLICAVAAFAPSALAQRTEPRAVPGSHQQAMDMPPMKMGMRGMEALKELSGREFNIAFLSQMIAHHRGAVAMAQRALKIARHSETKREARLVVQHQRKEIALMTAWLRKWYGVEPSREQEAMVRADMKPMTEMKIETDAMFFQMMMPHHRSAIEMSRTALARSDRAEVKTLARSIIKAQRAEIARYKTLLKHVR